MKIKYNKKGLTVTEGIHFENFCAIEASDTIGKKLLKHKNLFKEIKEVEEVEEVKTNNVDKTTKPKTTRTRKPKVDKAEEKEEKSE